LDTRHRLKTKDWSTVNHCHGRGNEKGRAGVCPARAFK
jgi:hypothetical protein